MRVENRFSTLDVFETRLSEIWPQAEKEREKLSGDPVTFFEQVVGFKPTAYSRILQKSLLKISLWLWDGTATQGKVGLPLLFC